VSYCVENDGVNLQAVVFDFDGLIVDTEWPIYSTALAAFTELGHELPLQTWATIVGLAEGEGGWYDSLCQRLGVDLARADFDRVYRAQDRSDRDRLPVLPGVVELLDALDQAGVGAGIASSSEVAWLERHLGRLGLLDRFDVLAGADRVGGVGKPAPDSYLFACRELGAEPRKSVALEDSAHGVAAARAAHMAVVAVPSRITRYTSLVDADLVVDDLTALSVADLDGLVARHRQAEGAADD
jgi:putative hydrolase of the HAD superfamily